MCTVRDLILAIDHGTTSSRALFYHQFRVIAEHHVPFPQHFPRPLWVEHHLKEIAQSVEQAVAHAWKKVAPMRTRIVAIGLSNQRETAGIWADDGTPLGPALVWQDRRTELECRKLRNQGLEPWLQKKTGLLCDPYFSATKWAWLLRSVSLQKKRKMRLGTMDTYLVYRMTNGQSHVTDPSNACRTLLYNIRTHSWDKELLDLFGISLAHLPKILPSGSLFGQTEKFAGLPNGIPIYGVCGDQQAALLGQGATQTGDVKCTYGTGAFLMANIGPKPIQSKHRLLTTIAWKTKDKCTYALEGSAFVAGAAIDWLIQNGILKHPTEIELLLKSVPGPEGVVFVPALAGLGAPHWNAHAHGAFFGLSRHTQRAHLVSATLHGIAAQTNDLLQAMRRDLGRPLKTLHVDGGMSVNRRFLKIQAQWAQSNLRASAQSEKTALGAALMAAFGVGMLPKLEQAKQYLQKGWFLPKPKRHDITPGNRTRWASAVRACIEDAKALPPA